MLKFELTATSLVTIIEACAKNGVAELELGKDVRLTFGSRSNEPTQVQPLYGNETPAVLETARAIEQESFERKQEEMQKDTLETMKLEDPVEYERLITSGELVDEREPEFETEN